MDDAIKSIISQVVKLNEKYEEIKKLNGENFNIFSILDMERNEVETHSKFIYELLNPNGSHSQGDLFLKLFMKIVLNLSTDDMVNSKVKREDITGTIVRNRRIDFTIETSKYQIGIEMKIDADDQDAQLKDYYIELTSRKNFLQEVKLFYLTLTGYEAQPYSSQDLEVHSDYFLISFESEILDWIERCIEKSATIPTLREGLVHYRNLIRKITNTLPIQMEQDMENIIRDSKDIKAMQTIVNEYPTLWAKKEMAFWNALWNFFENKEPNNEFEPKDYFHIWVDDNDNEFSQTKVEENIKNRRDKKYWSVGFILEKKYQNKWITIFIQDWGEGTVIGVRFYDNEENPILNEKLIEICNEIGLNRKSDTLKYKFLEHKISFYGRYQTNPTYDLFDNKQFNNYIESTQNEINNILNSITSKKNKILKAYQ